MCCACWAMQKTWNNPSVSDHCSSEAQSALVTCEKSCMWPCNERQCHQECTERGFRKAAQGILISLSWFWGRVAIHSIHFHTFFVHYKLLYVIKWKYAVCFWMQMEKPVSGRISTSFISQHGKIAVQDFCVIFSWKSSMLVPARDRKSEKVAYWMVIM